MSNKQTVDIYGKPYNRSLLVVVLLIGTFCTVLNQTLLTTAFPALMKAFDISASSVQWLTTGFLLVNGIMIPISAWLINKFSSKRLYLTAMTIFLIGTITCFVAPNFSTLLIGRLIQAAGVGISMPLLQNIMLSIFPPEKRGSAMGMAGIVIGLAPALGPTLSGWIIDHYTWRDLFGMVIPIVIFVLVLALFLMKSVIQLSNPSIDVLSAILSTVGFGSLLYGFSSVGNDGWGSAKVISFLVVGVIVIGLFVWRQLRLEHPFLELRVFKSPIFTIAAILSGVVNMAMVGAEMVLPLYIQNIRGESAFHSGLMLLPGALVMGLMMPITGAIFDKHGAKRLAISGMLILTAATLPFAFLTAETPIAMIVILYAMRMFGISMVMMPVTTSGMNALPMNLISHGTAVNNTFRQVASSIGTAILISVLTNVTKDNLPAAHLLKTLPLSYKNQAISATLSGYHAAFYVAVLFGVVGFIITFFLKTNKKMEEGMTQ
ncbi:MULTISPECIES: MDR family MFS transporter [Enterococcus]|uniref:MDR family MFS transporter n=1 Tax=Enterococcus TaxID=1350 RepID=UPI000A34085A|nr:MULTISPECIES: MDR family MFS transporter [Enterococcus]AXG39435.1 MFS transporter [Enterococcus gilvus]OTO71517.1 major facilitator superfamily transporter [Enterococcus sp. 12E11_DIV0728]OUZ15098.1 major facilitator superfamily transporter [Enterococcus sp. 12F9_DIV0723]